MIYAQNPIVVVLDAGHGGKDPGNLASKKNYDDEKDLNLKIALQTGKYIEDNLENVSVVYTRTTDEFISLRERVDIGNRNKADYFISIHCNSSKETSIQGIEIHIVKSSYKTSYELAQRLNKEFVERAKRYSRGIKTTTDRRKHLAVLTHTTMPAVLIECGFMTHPDEELYLNTEYGRSIIASAIYRAFRDYSGAKTKTKDQ